MVRLIDENSVACERGLAGDEALALSVAGGGVMPTLRLYSYEPCVIVGRYQNLVDAIDLEACKRYGYTWNRRHTGGGTVMMGPDQVAIGLAVPEDGGYVPRTVRGCFEFFAGIVAEALSRFGIEAVFVGKNDLKVEGRKIAGLAISQDIPGVTFFHGSLLLDFDVSRMVDVLHLPTRSLEDRGLSCFSQWMTTVRSLVPGVSFREMKDALISSTLARMGLVKDGSWLPEEEVRIARLLEERYRNEAWIYSSRVLQRYTGYSALRTPGGVLHVFLECTGQVIDSILITGDFFSRSVQLAELEAQIKGRRFDESQMRDIIGETGIYMVSNEDLTNVIGKAYQEAGKGRRVSPARMIGRNEA